MAAFSAQDLREIDTEPKDAAEPRVNPHAKELNVLAEEMAKRGTRWAISPVILEGLVRLSEFLITVAAGAVTFSTQAYDGNTFALEPLLTVPLMAIAQVFILQSLGTYRIIAVRMPERSGLRVAAAWIGAFAALYAALYVLHLGTGPRYSWILHWSIAGFVMLAVERCALFFLTNALARSGKLSRRTAIVGGGPAAFQLLQDLTEHGSGDLHIVGIFDDRTDDRSPDVVAGFPKLGNVDDLVGFARNTPLDLVIFTLPITAEQRLLVMLRKLWILPIDIRLAAHINKLRFRPRAYSYIGAVPVIDVFDKPIADWDIVIKNIFDRVTGLFCLMLAAPIMLLVAVAIKLDSPGPVLFRQKRYGFNNEQIDVFKFRSMYNDRMDYHAVKSVTRNDSRVTRVGRFIRRSSVDELPQLFNVVFKGNLSLVGPRPHVINAKAAGDLYDEVVDGYFARHRVLPGITGWAQINGWRGETDTPEKIQKRVEHDLYYIENWSIFFDMYVLLATPLSLITTKNAY
jgi:Undecaprenyl-phosphate glucose phosphotransferase